MEQEKKSRKHYNINKYLAIVLTGSIPNATKIYLQEFEILTNFEERKKMLQVRLELTTPA